MSDAPIHPPYPKPWEPPGWRAIFPLAGLVGTGLLVAGEQLPGAILSGVAVIWLAHVCIRIPGLRRRALDGLEARAPAMTRAERERDIAEIHELYGGLRDLEIQGRVERIRALPDPR